MMTQCAGCSDADITSDIAVEPLWQDRRSCNCPCV